MGLNILVLVWEAEIRLNQKPRDIVFPKEKNGGLGYDPK